MCRYIPFCLPVRKGVDVAVDALTSLLEPMLILFLGVTIGTLLIAMYMPIFQLAEVVGK